MYLSVSYVRALSTRLYRIKRMKESITCSSGMYESRLVNGRASHATVPVTDQTSMVSLFWSKRRVADKTTRDLIVCSRGVTVVAGMTWGRMYAVLALFSALAFSLFLLRRGCIQIARPNGPVAYDKQQGSWRRSTRNRILLDVNGMALPFRSQYRERKSGLPCLITQFDVVTSKHI